MKVLRPTRHKIGNFGDVLPIQSVGIVVKKLNLAKQKQTTTGNTDNKHEKKIKYKENQQSSLRTTSHVCACYCAPSSYR